jgi:amidohydrolase
MFEGQMKTGTRSLLFSAVIAACAFQASAQTGSEDWVAAAAEGVAPQVIDWRHHIHQHPELGNQEVETSKLVAEQLRAFGIDVRTGVAKTGVVGVLKGGKPGPVMALRADMDALPVKEQTGLPFASHATATWQGKKVDVMHACGHDAHTAMLLGAAKVLAENRDKIAGTVVFLFQPAEEGQSDVDPYTSDKPLSYGAKGMIEEGALDNPKVDVVFGLHVMSGSPTGQLSWKSGAILNSADSYRITVTGRQSHGSMPWTGVDPITTAAQIINGMQTLVSRRADLTQGIGVVSVGNIHGGTAGNIIPNEVTMEGTIRSNAPGIRDTLLQSLPPLAENIAKANQAQAKVTIADGVPVTMNDDALTRAMEPSLKKAASNKVVVLKSNASPSEDFSYYAEKVPGLFVFLGATPPDQDMSKAASNHSPQFIVDDNTLVTGVRTHLRFVMDYPQTRSDKG